MTTNDHFETVMQAARDLTAERQRLSQKAVRHRDELRRTVADVRDAVTHRRTTLDGIVARHPDLMGDANT